MVTKDQIQLVVSGKNETGPVFKDVTDEIKRLRAEASRPISLARVEQGDRDRLAGFTRGLRRAGNSAEERVRRDSLLPGRELSAGDLIREQNERFRATATSTNSAAGGVRNLSERFSELAVKAVAVTAALRGITAFVKLGGAVLADSGKNYKKASEGYLAFAESIGKIPIVGQFALATANALSGGALEAAQKALSDAEQIDKKTVELRQKMIAKIAARRAGGDELIQEGRQTAFDVGRRGVTDPLSIAQLALQEDTGRAASIRKRAKDLDPDQIKKANAQADEIELRARKVFESERVRITEAADKEIRDKTKANADEIRKINDDAAVTRLRNQGKELEASILAIQQANQREVEEAKGNSAKIYALKLRASEEIRGLRINDAGARARTGLNLLGGQSTETARLGATPFSGESKLLTGAGSSVDPVLQENKTQNKTLADLKKLTEQQQKDIGTIASLFAQGAQLIIGGVP